MAEDLELLWKNLSITEAKEKVVIDQMDEVDEDIKKRAVEAHGRSGRIVLLWKKDLNIDLKSFSPRYVDAIVHDADGRSDWRLTIIYGELNLCNRKKWWQEFQKLKNCSSLLWDNPVLWVKNILEKLDSEEKEKSAILAWFVWGNWNSTTYQGKGKDAPIILILAMQM
ncbi:hypothetical protein ACH5RR_031558 [Cinchona calisaya]|uniref:Uncharacterized protein n=1 Tax=Cinchona calisaya TaxID=153742 RepID=A0ABD2YGX7_9GENT